VLSQIKNYSICALHLRAAIRSTHKSVCKLKGSGYRNSEKPSMLHKALELAINQTTPKGFNHKNMALAQAMYVPKVTLA